MTKEELKQEAENWIVKYTGVDVETQRAIKLRYYDNLKNAYIASAEPREKRIAELEEQIEKMKCCGNCKHYTTFNNACMEYGYFLDKCDKTKWEIKEK